MTDGFFKRDDNVSAPARQCFVITPHATNPLPIIPKAIRADGDGVITLRAIDSDADVAHPVKAGEILPVRAEYVRVSGTTGQTTIIGYA